MRPAHPLPWHMPAAARRKRLFFGAPPWDSAQLSWPVAQQPLTAFTSSSHDAGSHPLTWHMRAAGISASSARARARETQICLLSIYAVYDARAVRGECVGTRARAGRRRFFSSLSSSPSFFKPFGPIPLNLRREDPPALKKHNKTRGFRHSAPFF